eukprot:gene15010-20196_t
MGNKVPTNEPTDFAQFCTIPGIVFDEEKLMISGQSRNISSWKEESLVAPKGIVIISHGLNEHGLCYYNIAFLLCKKGYIVFAIDHQSHGLSECPTKGRFISDYNIVRNDFSSFVNSKKEEYQNIPLFIFAHSLGTLITLAAMDNIANGTVQGIVLSGCALVPGPASASPFGISCLYPLTKTSFAACLTSFTSYLDPTGLAAPIIEHEITSNLEYLQQMKDDHRRNKPTVMNKTAFEALKLTKKAKELIPTVSVPILLIHGGDDKIALPISSQFVYDNIGTSNDKKCLSVFPGLKHEVIHEIEPKGEECRQCVIDFIDKIFGEIDSNQIESNSQSQVLEIESSNNNDNNNS